MNTIEDRPADRRRFTSIEGWREVGRGVYLAAGSTVASVAFDSNRNTRFDPEWGLFDDSDSIKTRVSKSEEQRRTRRFSQAPSSVGRFSSQSLENPFISPEEAEAERTLANSVTHAGTPDVEQRPRSEQPFHIYNKRQKWFLVVIIGIAGLFSGLSSNIYFPSLDAIARVRCLVPSNLMSYHVSRHS